MAVTVPDRHKSKVEYDNTYFAVYDDAIKIIKNNFGADKDKREEYKDYIRIMSGVILKLVMELGTHIRIANSAYPTCRKELEIRRSEQDKAIGICFDLLTKYDLIMHELRVKDDKYVQEIQHIIHEINCLKSWRRSDNKRFNDLG